MRLERTFEVNATASDCGDRLISFLQNLGYVREPGSALRFRRGALLGSLTSFSPNKWKTKASAAVERLDDQRSTVSFSLDVNTTGQLVTEGEREYWNKEIEGLQTAVRTGAVQTEHLTRDRELTARAGWKSVLLAAAIAIPAGIIVAIAAHFIDP